MKKRKLGIRAKFFLELGAIIAACFIGISFVNSQLLEKVYMWNVERNLTSMAKETENAGTNYFPLLTDFEIKENVSIDLYDNQDNYLFEGKRNYLSGNRINII